MKKLFTTIAFTITVLTLHAQQDPQWSQNMFNRLAVNPGYAGSNNGICATLLGRQQWMGFDGSPKTGLLSVEGTVDKLHGGLGLTVMYDKLGFLSNTAAKLAYSFRLPLGSGTLGIGVDAGIMNQALNPNFVFIDANDPSIPTGKASGIAPDLGFGLYYNTNKLYFGVASTHIIGGQIDFSNVKYSIARHYYAQAGYDYEINPSFTLKPSVFIKTDAKSAQFDVNLNLLYNNLVWGGVSYRVDDAVVALVGLQLGEFKVGYSYDITTSALKAHSSGSHEIMLGYCFKTTKPTVTQRYKNVRFL